MKPNPLESRMTSLDTWLLIATKNLCDDAVANIEAEVRGHVESRNPKHIASTDCTDKN